MTSPKPPKEKNPLQKREARMAWAMLLPTVTAVTATIILPLIAIFWISIKPVQLADLRPVTITVRETLRTGDGQHLIEYRVRNSSQQKPVANAAFSDTIPDNITPSPNTLPPECQINNKTIRCDFNTAKPGFSARIRIPVTLAPNTTPDTARQTLRNSAPKTQGKGDNILTNSTFTTDNFARIFDSREFLAVLGATAFYTVFGTVGALAAGLAAALVLNRPFRGKGLLRGLCLFPYVAPIIAVAFTWTTLLDPFSGSVNTLLVQMGVVASPVNFFGQKPHALVMVTLFEIWRYFPLSFLFILARIQAIDTDMYEAADMDGASPFQKFLYLSMPMLLGILSILFLLRFIWTFNKFDDIFLLTGGNAGTRTLTVNVYEQAFAVSNIGAGAAVAVVIFAVLLAFSLFFLRFISREEGL
ncbi:MAG: sugar ABC transporter permease [Alphaproteobacteria bacterium]|nr:sugar ABC transporter permease [Alphaproteobacteria bacterium]MDA8004486.1 sugar ABC transporter permease [Alphaproteobacteria bacterium]MDA8005484.1 sugar ABC transporter permease [Alphaproteobacteria bacterium]MDA8013758.1 sugar ABC transporter permease [Alphaproteobacteria bacterium]